MTGTAAAPDDDTGIRWLSVSAAIASISAVGIAIGLGVPLLSVILEHRGYSATAIGANTAIAGLASIPAAAPVAAPLAARFGVVATMIFMIVAGGLAFVGFYFAPSFWMCWFPLRIVLHAALTVLFILSEFWINASAPPRRRGLVLGVYATVLSLGFAFGPWLFARVGSDGFLPFGVAFALIIAAAFPVLAAWRESPVMQGEGKRPGFLSYVFLVPTATAAVLVFGAVETGGLALFPVYGSRIGYSQEDAALLLAMVGLGNVLLDILLGVVSDRIGDRRLLLVGCAAVGLAGMIALPFAATSWAASAALLFVWGGVVAGLYTIGLAHLGSKLSGRDLASANAAFVFCYGLGMLAGPQAIGLGMDRFGPDGFAYTLAIFFALYIALVGSRIVASHMRP